MRKGMKRVLIVGLVVAVMMTFAGCKRKEFDAAGYVKATLDMTMKGEAEDYIKFVGCSKEEALKDYEDTLDEAVEQFGEFGVNEEALEEFRQFSIDLYKAVKYEVKEAQKEKDGSYTVKVETEKMNVFAGAMEKFEEAAESYVEEIVAAALEGGEQLTDEKMAQDLYGKVIALFKESLASATYQEPTTVEVKVSQDDDGVWEIPEKDFEVLELSLIDIDAME